MTERMSRDRDLARDLRGLGVVEGDRLAVHSSYKAIGPVDGGPAAVVRALMGAVGEGGTLLMPVFNEPPDLFCLDETASTCGIITEMFRKMPDVSRSLHPTHSVAAWGKDAEWIASAHEEGRTALGVDSPFDRLSTRGGKILLLGVGHNRNSTVHVGEAHFGPPYFGIPYTEGYSRPIKVRNRLGKLVTFTIRQCPGCSRNFCVVGDRMQEKGMLRKGTVGNAESTIMRGADVIETVAELLEESLGTLLCDDPKCVFCPTAQKRLAQARDA